MFVERLGYNSYEAVREALGVDVAGVDGAGGANRSKQATFVERIDCLGGLCPPRTPH
jgi:hypothetical protein